MGINCYHDSATPSLVSGAIRLLEETLKFDLEMEIFSLWVTSN